MAGTGGAVRIRDSVAIVTGASRGIGRATSLALGGEGARVVLAARTGGLLEELADRIRGSGGEAIAVPTDVSENAEVEHLLDRTLERWGPPDILVASAGVYLRRPIVELAPEDLERSLSVNFYGAVRPILASLPHMLVRGRGHILLLNSIDGLKAIPPDAPYATAKFALAGFTEILRQELRGSGVDVTSIFPGRVDTAMIEWLQVPWVSRKLPPEAVARSVLDAIRRPRAEVVLPASGRLFAMADALSPRLGDWIVRRFRLQGWERTHRPSDRP
jgi:NAD(P)-dependent dehydrogenase (short-subunit alcohol dehydrogenase family)